MPQYLVAIQHPNDFNPSQESAKTMRDIDVLNEEMEAAGVRSFAGGLEAPSRAKSLREEPSGNTAVTDGPFLEAKEYVGGFWILNCATMDEAVTWGKKLASPAARPLRFVRSSKCRPSEKFRNLVGMCPGRSLQ